MLVLDTCVVIWLAGKSPMVSKAAAEGIEKARRSGALGIAGSTLYELAWLIRQGRISVSSSLEVFVAEVESHFHVLPITAAIVRLAVELPASYPADPVDRIIGATALAHGGALVTRDVKIRKSKAVPVLW